MAEYLYAQPVTSTDDPDVVLRKIAYAAQNDSGGTPSTPTTPGGSSGQVQYNNAGAFGGASLLTYDSANSRLGIGNTSPDSTLTIGNITSGSVTQKIIVSAAQLGAGTSPFKIEYFNGGGLAEITAGGGMTVASNITTVAGGFNFSGAGIILKDTPATDTGNALSVASNASFDLRQVVMKSVRMMNALGDAPYFEVKSNGQMILAAIAAPASAAAAGATGEIRWDTGFIYVCTATNTWKRVAIATW